MTEEAVIEAEVVEEAGTALVPTAPVSLFKTDDPVEVVTEATRVADALKSVIVQKQLFATIQGKSHVTVEGWTLLGSMLGVTAVVTDTVPVDGGFKARVEARAADGRVVGAAEALCTKYEKRGPWKSADDYARLSMAQTRATSKALKGPLGFIVSLAGYESTPSEEMTFAVPDPPVSDSVKTGLSDLPSLTDERIEEVRAALKGRTVAELRDLFSHAGVNTSGMSVQAMKHAVTLLSESQAAKVIEAAS